MLSNSCLNYDRANCYTINFNEFLYIPICYLTFQFVVSLIFSLSYAKAFDNIINFITHNSNLRSGIHSTVKARDSLHSAHTLFHVKLPIIFVLNYLFIHSFIYSDSENSWALIACGYEYGQFNKTSVSYKSSYIKEIQYQNYIYGVSAS